MKDTTMTRKGRIVRSRGLEPALPELERRLTTAAAAQMKASRQSLGRRVVGFRGSRIAAAGLACLAFVGSAMAAGVWNPEIGTDTGIEGSGAPLSGQGPPTMATTPVPAAATEVLGVLRRDPTVRDRGSEVEATLANVAFVDRVRPDSVRFLAPGDRGKATILLSAETSLDTEISKSSLKLSEEEEEPVCVFRPGALGYGHVNDVPSACFGLSDLLAGRAYTEELNSPPGRGLAFGLVPDGVASVTAEFANAVEVTVPVRDNYFEIPMSGAQLGEGKGDLKGGVQRVVWRDTDGALVPQQSDGGDESGTPASLTERLTFAEGAQSPSSP
jgi:hypothetical protein